MDMDNNGLRLEVPCGPHSRLERRKELQKCPHENKKDWKEKQFRNRIVVKLRSVFIQKVTI